MSFLLDSILEQCGYHLGSAIDDNPLAVLASQYCGGSPRVSSEMYLLHTGNNFPAVLYFFISGLIISARLCYPYLSLIY
ncbi:hypothetical protein D7Y06_23265 [Roseburia sp. 1XD42-69]|nr:hypothetical protein D7Y06_23265 [Roseburia sp. 1XD42-69]